MEETRYSFDQISKVSGIDVYVLERKRRASSMAWQPKGYTVEEIKQMLGSAPLLRREEINPRAYKALVLWEQLTKGAAG